ncbi:SMI1/KNR4 family protein [Lysinibacillus cavernae]|uniref:SMI1/KNR4 family protein n=1 Tax=Lysinibacillus cavernae TaxID=2666135 RepID=UPI0012D8B795|nr:SMI1/KNR4 family protein [Lysinibacillus cavernae]
MWIERWHHLLKQLKCQGACIPPIEIRPVATEQELWMVEERLGVQIPKEFRHALQNCSQQVSIFWSLPDVAILPTKLVDTPSGDFGWSLRDLDFPYFGENDELNEQQYLQFYTGGNGDALLIKLEDESIWYWSHEEDVFDFLATNFHAYVDNITTLGCIGVDCGQHRQFCDENGLNVHKTSSQIWLTWLEQYVTFNLKQAKSSLESLLLYVSMHGANEVSVQEAFLRFDSGKVYQAIRNRIEQALSPSHQKAWSEVLVKVCANEAEKWVRALWQVNNDIPSWLRDYLTAHCLPANEGQLFILEDIEKDRVDAYIALCRLRHFHHPNIIEWMKSYTAFPIDGWDTLLAESQPSAETLLEWLNGSEVERLTSIRAISYMMQQGMIPTTIVDEEKWRPLLTYWTEHEVLRKNKQLFSQALNGLENWILKCYMPQRRE